MEILVYTAGFAYFSCFLTSLISYFGVNIPSSFPLVGSILGIGIFFQFLVAMFVSWKFGDNDHRSYTGDLDKAIKFLKDTPKWIIFFGVLTFFYTLINFAYSASKYPGSAVYIESGRYILRLKGKFIEEVTKERYLDYKLNNVRSFYGHLTIFYFVSFAIIYSSYSKLKKSKSLTSTIS